LNLAAAGNTEQISVNDQPVTDEAATLSNADVVDGAIKLSFGKKKHALLRVN